MKGHISVRNGRYRAQVYLGRDDTGKPRYRNRTFRVKRAAQMWLHDTISAIERGEDVAPTHQTVADYLTHWLESTRNTRAGSTHHGYSKIVHNYLIPWLGRHSLSSLKPLHVQAYYAAMLSSGRKQGGGLSAQSVVHHHRLLHKALHDAVRWGIMPRNACDVVEPPKIAHRERDTYSREQIQTILAAAQGTHYYIPILLAAATGMRRGELLALWWSDFDGQAGCLHINRAYDESRPGLAYKEPKTPQSRRTILLSPTTVRALVEHRKGHPQDTLICTQESGKPISPQLMSNAWHRLLDKVGLPHAALHNLRHTFATEALKAGIHPKIVQSILGHSTIRTTLDTYSHVTPDMQVEAVGVMDEFLSPIMPK